MVLSTRSRRDRRRAYAGSVTPTSVHGLTGLHTPEGTPVVDALQVGADGVRRSRRHSHRIDYVAM